MKQKTSFLIPLLMAIVMMAMSPQRAWADDESTNVLQLGKNVVNISGYPTFSFTPDKTGIYRFYSEGDVDLEVSQINGVSVYSTTAKGYNDIGEKNLNFDWSIELTEDTPNTIEIYTPDNESAENCVVYVTYEGESSGGPTTVNIGCTVSLYNQSNTSITKYIYNDCTAYFNYNGAKDSYGYEIQSGEYTFTAEEKVYGFSFAGWYLDDNLVTTDYTFTATISSNSYYEARYVANDTTVIPSNPSVVSLSTEIYGNGEASLELNGYPGANVVLLQTGTEATAVATPTSSTTYNNLLCGRAEIPEENDVEYFTEESSLTFTVVGRTTLTARFSTKQDGGESANVLQMDANTGLNIPITPGITYTFTPSQTGYYNFAFSEYDSFDFTFQIDVTDADGQRYGYLDFASEMSTFTPLTAGQTYNVKVQAVTTNEGGCQGATLTVSTCSAPTMTAIEGTSAEGTISANNQVYRSFSLNNAGTLSIETDADWLLLKKNSSNVYEYVDIPAASGASNSLSLAAGDYAVAISGCDWEEQSYTLTITESSGETEIPDLSVGTTNNLELYRGPMQTAAYFTPTEPGDYKFTVSPATTIIVSNGYELKGNEDGELTIEGLEANQTCMIAFPALQTPTTGSITITKLGTSGGTSTYPALELTTTQLGDLEGAVDDSEDSYTYFYYTFTPTKSAAYKISFTHTSENAHAEIVVFDKDFFNNRDYNCMFDSKSVTQFINAGETCYVLICNYSTSPLTGVAVTVEETVIPSLLVGDNDLNLTVEPQDYPQYLFTVKAAGHYKFTPTDDIYIGSFDLPITEKNNIAYIEKGNYMIGLFNESESTITDLDINISAYTLPTLTTEGTTIANIAPRSYYNNVYSFTAPATGTYKFTSSESNLYLTIFDSTPYTSPVPAPVNNIDQEVSCVQGKTYYVQVANSTENTYQDVTISVSGDPGQQITSTELATYLGQVEPLIKKMLASDYVDAALDKTALKTALDNAKAALTNQTGYNTAYTALKAAYDAAPYVAGGVAGGTITVNDLTDGSKIYLQDGPSAYQSLFMVSDPTVQNANSVMANADGKNKATAWTLVATGQKDAIYTDKDTYYLYDEANNVYFGATDITSIAETAKRMVSSTDNAYAFSFLTKAEIDAKEGRNMNVYGLDNTVFIQHSNADGTWFRLSRFGAYNQVYYISSTVYPTNNDWQTWGLHNAGKNNDIAAELAAAITEIEENPLPYIGTQPGFIPEASVAPLNKAIANAKTIDASNSRSQYREAIEDIYNALSIVKASEVNPIVEGYYYLTSAWDSKASANWVAYDPQTDENYLKGHSMTTPTKYDIFYIKPLETGYSIQNLGSGKYVGQAIDANKVTLVETPAEDLYQQLTYMSEGQFQWKDNKTTFTYYVFNDYIGRYYGQPAASSFDRWYLNIVPQEVIEEFVGSYSTEVADNCITVSGTVTADNVATILAANPTATSINLSGATLASDITAQSLTSALTGNQIAFVSTESGISGTNIVAGNTCDQLVLTDKEDFAPAYDFTATSATYGKTLAEGGWYSCVLPYQFTIPEGVTVLNNASISGNTVTLDEATGTVPANTPFLYKKADGGTITFAAANVDVDAAAGTSGSLKGTYTKIPAGSATGKLILNSTGSAFAEASATASIPAFRAYIDGVAGSNIFTIVINDDLTGVASFDANGNVDNTPVDVYTINGKLVRKSVNPVTALQGLESGIYIINGKKFKK